MPVLYKEQIRQEAIKCRFCGEWLEPSEPVSAGKLTTDKPVLPPPILPQEGTEPNSMKAVGRCLDEMYPQHGPANPQDKTTPKASATTGTRKKSVWRLIGGVFLLGGASNSMRNFHPPAQYDLASAIGHLTGVLLFGGIGLGLVVSYLAKRPRRALLILSVGWLLVIADVAYSLQKSAESNKQFGNALRVFANDWQRYVEAGGTRDAPIVKPTGDATTDLIGRCMNDLFQEAGSFFDGMNRELNALGEKGVFETSVLSDKRSLETESRKRIEGQRIIETYRNDLPRTFDAWRQKLASYNLPNEQKKDVMNGIENVRPKLSHQYETLLNLLGKKQKPNLIFCLS